MRFVDLLTLPIAALLQQKGRTVLTTLGVVFGSFVLAASLSIGQGVQDLIERESHRSDFLRNIHVSAGNPSKSEDRAAKISVEGKMTDARRDRLRQALQREKERRVGRAKPALRLTREKIRTLTALPHVQDGEPAYFVLRGRASFNGHEQVTGVQTARVDDRFVMQRVIAGRGFRSAGERSVLVSEFLLYRLGIVDEAAMNAAVGKKLRLELDADVRRTGLAVYLFKPDGSLDTTREEAEALETIRQQLPRSLDKLGLMPDQIKKLRKAMVSQQPAQKVVAEEYEIAGVIRAPAEGENPPQWYFEQPQDVVLPVETALDLYFRIPSEDKDERVLDNLIVRVDDEHDTKAVYQQIKDLGWSVSAPLDFVERERLQYLLIFAGMTCVAVVALFVAALGIANTMLMSVLERTREIGIMKAVGASKAQLQLTFLIEGALIGSIGGGLGLLLAWGASFPGDAWVRSFTSRTVEIKLTEAMFVFPSWLILLVLGFAVVVTTLAAVYPARRAAQIDPVAALRHE